MEHEIENTEPQVEAATEAASDDDAMREAYRSLTENPADEPDSEPDSEPEDLDSDPEDLDSEADEADEADEEAAPAVSRDALRHLPKDIRAHWDKLPEDARDVISSSYKTLTDKMAEQGRAVKAARPIVDRLDAVRNEIPYVANMSDEQLISGVYELAKTEATLAQNPLQGVLSIVERFGVADDLRRALGVAGEGGQDTRALLNEISGLKAQLSQAFDPAHLENMVADVVDKRSLGDVVSEFASSAEHWEAVENDIAAFYIPKLREIMPDATPQAILQRAYDMAVNADPELRATLAPPPKAPPQGADTKKREAAKKAASISVKTTTTGRTRALSEDEELRAAYRKATQG